MLAVSPAPKRRPEHTEIAKLLIAKGAPGKDAALGGAIGANDAPLAKYEELAKNAIGESLMTTPAISDRLIIFRGRKNVYAIKAQR